MTETKTTPRKKAKRVKLRAMRELFYNNRIVTAGEVFDYEGEPPSEEIAIPADSEAPLGITPEKPEPLTKDAPEWTTKGFVDRANREVGRNEDDSEPVT